jgi:hypothetical protein
LKGGGSSGSYWAVWARSRAGKSNYVLFKSAGLRAAMGKSAGVFEAKQKAFHAKESLKLLDYRVFTDSDINI